LPCTNAPRSVVKSGLPINDPASYVNQAATAVAACGPVAGEIYTTAGKERPWQRSLNPPQFIFFFFSFVCL
jgi:hypothetical protein